MSPRQIALAVSLLVCCLGMPRPAVAGPVTFADFGAFSRAVGAGLREIDFETLPDGTPSFRHASITPDFNYTDQGISFSSPFPVLRIGTPSMGQFHLQAQNPDTSARNWIIGSFTAPAMAVGIFFPGGTALSAFDAEDRLIARIHGGGGGAGHFLGVVSDVPIARMAQDGGASGEIMESILFAPVPEPASLLLLGAGMVAVIRRRRASC